MYLDISNYAKLMALIFLHNRNQGKQFLEMLLVKGSK